MVAKTDDISRNEHLLAEKAQGILEHQRQLQSLQSRKEELEQGKPTADKQQLSYEESLQFGEQVKQYEKKVHRIEVQIQKLKRELCGLQKQAKKLIPVSNVNVKVSTHSGSENTGRTYCIKYIKETKGDESEEHFVIERLQ